MRVFILSIFFIFCFPHNNYADRSVELNAHVVVKGKTDTVFGKLSAKRSVLDNDQITFVSILESPLTFYRNGIKEKIKIEDIEYLEFDDLQGVTRIFIQEENVGLKDRRRKLVEVVYKGTVLFCRRYKQNNNAGSGRTLPSLGTSKFKPAVFGGTPYTYVGVDYFIYEDYEPLELNLYWKKDKLEFAELLQDRPELKNRILELKTYEELVEILKDYDTDPEIIASRAEHSSPESRSNTLKILNSIDSINTKKIESAEELKVGDFIKYVGPGNEKFGVVKKIISAKAVMMTYDLENDPKEFMIRVSDLELIIE